ncbi:MAG: sulfotransferase [Deltaproteobacteria bacterium]|nr:sulfotransferase [Deltaproteobacteria bacterium]MBW2419980.1 sulfotransferase [Deltaproteobacteria bacterium]
MSGVSFDPTTLLGQASETAGLSDFGPDDFREPLSVLCKTLEQGPLTEKGRKRNHRRLVGLLATRLRVQKAFLEHPEIRQRELPKPMVLTGLPRSGTSALFNLLAADPATRPLLLWETQFPDPAEDLAPGDPDPRHLAIKKYYEDAQEKNPEFTKMHFASADTPEECVLLHAYSLNGVHVGWECMLEPYTSWYREQDLQPMYAYYRDLLRLLDWQRPGDRWLLKAPAHMWAIEALIENFPDVSIVWSHRDPLLCTASICSMTHTLLKMHAEMEAEQLGPIVMDFYATSLERGLAARDRSDPSRFVDVTHDEFVADSLHVVERIYEHFDMPVEASARSAFEAHTDANPKGKHGKHKYALEEYGLDAEAVRRRFAPYIERFGIELVG